MDTAFISAFSALAGSIVGGMTSGITTWLGHRTHAQAGRRLYNMSQRENLYRDFVVAASEAYGHAIRSEEPQIEQIVVLHGMISRMRILSSPEIVACAEKTVNSIIDVIFIPKKSFLEMRELIRSGEMIDPLREFSEISREELQSL